MSISRYRRRNRGSEGFGSYGSHPIWSGVIGKVTVGDLSEKLSLLQPIAGDGPNTYAKVLSTFALNNCTCLGALLSQHPVVQKAH